jgi:predicted transcriptional regulator
MLQVDDDKGVDNMKNVTITLSNDLLQVLDGLCEDCNLSRYAFTKEALLEKIEKQIKINSEKQEKEDMRKADDVNLEEEKISESDFWNFFK